jgi:uncharacterized RDD family membrane protein YckC
VSASPTASRTDAVHVIPAEARGIQGRRAGVVTRTLAATVDAVVVALGAVGIYAAVAGFLFLRRGDAFRFPTVGLATAIAAWVHLFIVYLAVGWATTGRTYGAQVLGLRVVDRRGGRLGAGWGFVRALLCVYVPFGLVWVVFSRENRSLQDLVLRSSVIYDWDVRPRSERGTTSGAAATETTTPPG